MDLGHPIGEEPPVSVLHRRLAMAAGIAAAGHLTRFGRLGGHDVAVAEHEEPAYFANARDRGQRFRVYTAALPLGSGSGLVRISRAANADDGTLRNAALILAGSRHQQPGGQRHQVDSG
jgi:hypothetical protein